MLRQMATAHNPRSPHLVLLTLMSRQKLRHFRLHRLRQQRTGAFAQYLVQRIAYCVRNPWLLQLQNVIVSHGVFTPYKRLMIPEEPSRIRRLLISPHQQLSSIAFSTPDIATTLLRYYDAARSAVFSGFSVCGVEP